MHHCICRVFVDMLPGRWKPLAYFVQRTFAPLAVHILEANGRVEVWGKSVCAEACWLPAVTHSPTHVHSLCCVCFL